MNNVSLILSSEEIVLITGRRRTSSQARAFALMGIKYRLRPNGSIVVSRAHFEGMMGNIPVSKQKPKIEPNWEALNG